MPHPTDNPWLAIDSSAETAQFQPARGQSATLLVTRVLLGVTGMCALIVLIVSAPTRVTFPLGLVLVGYALGAAVASLAERGRGATRIRRVSARRTSIHEDGESAAAPSTPGAAWFALAMGSLALLGLAFVVPEEFGTRFAASGVLGLLILRLAAIHGRWAPRGSVWITSERSLETAHPQHKGSTNHDRRIRRWPKRQPDGLPAYDRRQPSRYRR